jgi:hypothetical protein
MSSSIARDGISDSMPAGTPNSSLLRPWIPPEHRFMIHSGSEHRSARTLPCGQERGRALIAQGPTHTALALIVPPPRPVPAH